MSEAVATVKKWMFDHGYSTGGGDNIPFLLLHMETQMWDRVSRDHEAAQQKQRSE